MFAISRAGFFVCLLTIRRHSVQCTVMSQLAKMKADARERRARLFNPSNAVKDDQPPKPLQIGFVPRPEPEPPPLPKQKKSDVLSARPSIRVAYFVGRYFNLPPESIKGERREKRFVKARQLTIYILREDFKFSLTQIGRCMNRDHSTVLHSIRSVNRQIAKGEQVIKDLEKIREALRNPSMGIQKNSTSYPFLAIAREFDVDYGEVLKFADSLSSGPLRTAKLSFEVREAICAKWQELKTKG